MRCGQLTLTVGNLDRSTAFYTRVCGMAVCTPTKAAAETVWLNVPGALDGFKEFRLVLRQGTPACVDPLGLDCDSRQRVDAIADQAQRRGHLLGPPVVEAESGDYRALVQDPDGHKLVFRVPSATRDPEKASARRRPRWALALSLLGGLAGLAAVAAMVLGQLPTAAFGMSLEQLRRPMAMLALFLVSGIFWALGWQRLLAAPGRRVLGLVVYVSWMSLYALPIAGVLLVSGWMLSPLEKPQPARAVLASIADLPTSPR